MEKARADDRQSEGRGVVDFIDEESFARELDKVFESLFYKRVMFDGEKDRVQWSKQKRRRWQTYTRYCHSNGGRIR